MSTIEKTVVIPDLHGRSEFLESIRETYTNINPRFVIAGDLVSGPRVPESIELAKEMKAKLIMGNHEWVMLASMFEENKERRYEWCEQRWRRYGTAMLSAYGVEHPPTPRSAQTLKQKMDKKGHLDYVLEAPLFYEGASKIGRFVVTHAGITGTNWTQQRVQLKIAKQNQLDGDYGDPTHPIPQLFGSMLINQAARTAGSQNRPISIRGHYHSTNNENRISSNGKVITLSSANTEFSSRSHTKLPIFVFESWSGEAREIYAA